MIILGIDTSGREGSLAVAEGDASSFEVLEFRPLAGGTYSAKLIPELASALAARSLRTHDIDLFAVCTGPGSFTGLRVGIAAVKGLAEVTQRPITAVTMLEAIAINARRAQVQGDGRGSTARVITALDAQRNEVFAGEYDFSHAAKLDSGPEKITESLATVADFSTWLSARVPVPTTFTPDAKIEEAVCKAGSPAQHIARPAADTIARIGLQRFLAGKTVPAIELDADYIRRSDAEIFSAPKLGITT